MKILRVINSMDPQSGGPCQGIRNSIEAMNAFDVQNEVVCLDRPDSDFISKDNFPVHALGPGIHPWKYSPKLIPWLQNNVDRFDAIIVHGIWLYSSQAVQKVMSKGKQVPWFVMPHGMLDPYFQNTPERKLKAIRNKIYWKLIEKRVVNCANGLLFTTQEELLLARKTFSGYNPKKELNVGYGIQPPPAQTAQMLKIFFEKVPELKHKSFVLFLGRIHPKKGADMLVKAFSELKNNNTALVIAGPGEDSDYGRQLIKFVREKGLIDQILFPGMLQGEAKWGAFYASEAFVLPSHQENFGIAVAEALACGKPVLISDKVNIWREVHHSGAGIIEPDTQEGTKKMLHSWLCTPQGSKESMKDKATKAFRDNFDINTNVKELLKVLIEEGGQ